MHFETIERYHQIIGNMGNHFHDNLYSSFVSGKGEVRELAIQTPFLLRDETNLGLRLREEGDDIILHDN